MKYQDKIKHFLLAFVLAALIYWLTKNTLLAIIAVLLLSLGKEMSDQARGKNTFKESLFDILADALGITLGILFIQFIIL